MPINNTTPVIVPAVSATPELEYDQLWLTNIVIEARDQTVGQISIQAVPYSTTSGTFADTNEVLLIQTDELWTAVAEVSSVGIAMDAIFTATTDLRTWIAARNS
tara:strand:- start:10603 stop:10914 length:312 start_codon:yes stop_codon:yes gene_type:complete